MSKQIQNQGTGSLFENSFLERLTRTHIAVPVSLFFLYSIALLYWNIRTVGLSPLKTTGLFIAGLLFFTLMEYLVHRFLFHIKPDTKLKSQFQYKFHGVHHEFPKDKDRIAMPPLVSLSIATLLLFFFKAIIGDYVFSFLPGILCGYAAYLLVHYLVHIFKPPKNFLRIWWIHHSIHHYKSPNRAFGVSSPLWDYVFRTMP